MRIVDLDKFDSSISAWRDSIDVIGDWLAPAKKNGRHGTAIDRCRPQGRSARNQHLLRVLTKHDQLKISPPAGLFCCLRPRAIDHAADPWA